MRQQAAERASRGCWAEAEAAYAAARQALPQDAELRDLHVRALLRLKRFDDANAIYARADAARPNDIGVLASWGGMLVHADRPAEAVDRLQRA